MVAEAQEQVQDIVAEIHAEDDNRWHKGCHGMLKEDEAFDQAVRVCL